MSGRSAEISGEDRDHSPITLPLGYWRNHEATVRAFSTNGDGPHVAPHLSHRRAGWPALPDGSIRLKE